MLRQIVRLIRSNRGQNIVEFALVLPILLFLVLAMMEGGRVMYQQILATEAAREGARAVAISGDRNTAGPAAQKFNPSFTATVSPNPMVATLPVEVEVYVNIPIVVPGINKWIPNPFKVSSKSTVRLEGSPIN